MKRKIFVFLASILVITLLSSSLALAQETDIENVANDAAEDSSGDSSGDSGEMSEEDMQAILQALMQMAGNSAETENDATDDASSGSGTMADSIMESLLQSAGNTDGETDIADGSSGSSSSESALYGKPWVNAMEAGNLPEAAPEAVDDLILHYNFDILKEHQDGSEYSGMTATAGEVKDFMTSYLEDASHDSHDIQQMRIFYDQAADFEALKESGLSELQPYLDMVEGAWSIEELNAVLMSEDFPFSPWADLFVGAAAQDREDTNHLMINPRFLFVDIAGEESLSDSDDYLVQTMRSSMLLQKALPVTDALVALGVPSEETNSAVMNMLNLEKAYGKYCNPNDVKYQEYGAYADTVKNYTLEELAEVSPNFPLTGILARFGKDKAAGFAVQYPEWITALNELWTEDNLDLLKRITQAKIIMECQNLLDPDIFEVSRAALKQEDPEPQDRAYTACDTLDTFSQVIAKTYVEECLGQETFDRLTEMAQGLIDTYKTMVDSATWLGEESQQKVLDKLNNMKLNILYPEGGYFNYNDLELVPTEEGGTLISNYLRLKEYKNLCENEVLDQKTRCVMSWYAFKPTMVNAFYAEFDNSINIIPGIITSNIYSKDMTDSEMLGSIGYVVGHEISHAFDFRGSQMDEYGRPGSIFTEDDVDGFLNICSNLAAYYDTIEYMDGQYVDGKRVNVEAAADLSGMQVVLSYARTLSDYDLTKLFEHAARTFATVGPQGTAYSYVAIDNHPLGYLRVNVDAQMFDEFYETYGCEEGDGMYLAPERRIRFWGE